ncbi:hypothetical protein DSL17_14520, partial [Mycobacterium tuberculosis]|uniref:hypothetical protein n=1 Tax=Mycobacterium tuberculosis TaxID=1773 RepID=UPI000E363064
MAGGASAAVVAGLAVVAIIAVGSAACTGAAEASSASCPAEAAGRADARAAVTTVTTCHQTTPSMWRSGVRKANRCDPDQPGDYLV